GGHGEGRLLEQPQDTVEALAVQDRRGVDLNHGHLLPALGRVLDRFGDEAKGPGIQRATHVDHLDGTAVDTPGTAGQDEDRGRTKPRSRFTAPSIGGPQTEAYSGLRDHRPGGLSSGPCRRWSWSPTSPGW